MSEPLQAIAGVYPNNKIAGKKISFIKKPTNRESS